jgi:hypothetical protein
MRGIELEFRTPQRYMAFRGSLGVVFYTSVGQTPEMGVADLELRRLAMEAGPNKIQTVYQIPIRQNHGFKTSPYVTVPTGVVAPQTFPLVFRIMPVAKGLNAEVEAMRFTLTAKPVYSDEGALKMSVRYPEALHGKPFTLLIDDTVVENPAAERLLKEGSHQLVVLSDDYRNQSRRFVIERGKSLDLVVQLEDSIPLVLFEAPANARVYYDGALVDDHRTPFPTTPGEHEVRFQVGDYALVKPLTVERGKTYKVALMIDAVTTESE